MTFRPLGGGSVKGPPVSGRTVKRFFRCRLGLRSGRLPGVPWWAATCPRHPVEPTRPTGATANPANRTGSARGSAKCILFVFFKKFRSKTPGFRVFCSQTFAVRHGRVVTSRPTPHARPLRVSTANFPSLDFFKKNQAKSPGFRAERRAFGSPFRFCRESRRSSPVPGPCRVGDPRTSSFGPDPEASFSPVGRAPQRSVARGALVGRDLSATRGFGILAEASNREPPRRTARHVVPPTRRTLAPPVASLHAQIPVFSYKNFFCKVYIELFRSIRLPSNRSPFFGLPELRVFSCLS